MDAATFGALVDEADELGFAGDVEAPSSLAPWEEIADGHPPSRTLRTLVRLGRENAAVAFAIHQRALARATLRALGVSIAHGPMAVAPQGWSGLGRTAIARWLAERDVDAEDRALLRDAYAPDATRILPMEPAAGGLLVPTFGDEGFAWHLHAPHTLTIDVSPHGHGLDELHTVRVRASAAPTASVSAGVDDLARAIAAEQLGIVAIALGSAERSHAMARAFAAQRTQGGATIDRHPVVLALLGKARAAIATVGAQLDALGRRPVARASVGDVLACRACAMPALAEAALAAMQTFGGIGYMRDVGVEKVSRDVNVLRAIAGAPPELTLIVAEWERLGG